VSITPSSQPLSPSRPARDSGSVMFSMAVSVGTRLYDWKTKPMRSRRSSVRSFSGSLLSSMSPMNTWPEVSESSPAMQCMSVDLPEPEGPMMAVNRPAGMSTETSSSARTAVSPRP
jgi:hypothetical protein